MASASALAEPAPRPSWSDELEDVANMEGASWLRMPANGEAEAAPAYLVLHVREEIDGNPRVQGKLGLDFVEALYEDRRHLLAYVLEGLDPESQLTYEDIGVGPYFLRRYYVATAACAPRAARRPPDGLLLVAAAADRPLRWHEYRALRRLLARLGDLDQP